MTPAAITEIVQAVADRAARYPGGACYSWAVRNGRHYGTEVVTWTRPWMLAHG